MLAEPRAASPRAERSGASAGPGVEQPPPWRVSPWGEPRLRRDGTQSPFPLTGPGRCPPTRPARIPGSRDSHEFWYSVCSPAPCPLPQHKLGGRLTRGARKVLRALILLLFFPSKSSFWKSSNPSVSSCRKSRSPSER